MADTRKIINLNYDVQKLFSVPIHYLQIDNFERYLEELGIFSQENGTIIGTTYTSMTMLSIKSLTTNKKKCH